MSNLIFSKQTLINAPLETVFAYHEREGAFNRLNPPWEPVEVIRNDGSIRDEAQVHLKMKLGPIPQYFRLIHRNYRKNDQFEDHQITGPFAYWVHQHKMKAAGENQTLLEDRMEYRLPLGIFGRIFGSAFARAKLERMFTYRHEITAQDLAAHQTYVNQPRLKIAVTGASGLVGSQLVPFLTTGGHIVKRMVRRPIHNEGEISWNPEKGDLQPHTLAGLDAVVHLAGESIANKRWSAKQKQKIIASRTQGTRLLAQNLANLPAEQRPKTLIMASAMGYYGDRGADYLHEESSSGDNFQAEVCRRWEEAVQPAIEAGIRVVILRIGIVLSMSGGALQKMLLPFQLGVGGVLGDGKHYMSWIALDDLIGVIHHALMNKHMEGVYNTASPNPVTNRDYTKTLGRVLGRPTLFPVPAFGLRLLFGKLADELLLGSLRLETTKLQQSGYQFRYPELESALQHVLGRRK